MTDRSLVLGLVLLCLMLGAGVLNLAASLQQQRDAEWVRHTHEVLQVLHRFRSHVSEARLALRGDPLMGIQPDLQGFRTQLDGARQRLARFTALTRDNPAQQQAARALEAQLRHLEDLWTRSVAVYRERGGRAAAESFAAARGQAALADLYGAIDSAQSREQALLLQRAAQSRQAYSLSLWAAVLSAVGSTALVGLYILQVRRAAAATRELTESLQEADRRKDAFIAVLSHELRNPLAPIRAAAQILARNPDPAKVRWTSGVLERQSSHMAALLEELLDAARISQGRIRLDRRPVALDEVVQAAIEAGTPALQARQHTLHTALPPGPVTLHADPVRLTQVITNLLGNAARYTAPGGTIAVEAATEGDTVLIRVRDNGIGISAQEQERIFRMFEQVDPVTSSSRSGLGVGLALSRLLVELHGGTLTVHSDGPGTGSEFVVRLPGSVVPASPAPAD